MAKLKRGRPSDYKPEYAEALIEHFNKPIYHPESEKVKDFPTLAGFAIKLGVHRDTLHEWASAVDEKDNLKHPEFSDAYKRTKDFQEEYLLQTGLRGDIHPTVGIFTMKNVLGYRDKQKDEPPDVSINNIHNFDHLSNEEIDARIRELMKEMSGEKQKKK